jgi:signal transduction histidine kinase
MMRSGFNPRRWPLAIKVPALVALFMLGVSIVITNAVLSRLKHTQERHLATLSTTYLEGLATALIPHVLHDDVWEVFDAIDRRASLGGEFGRAEVVVVNGRGQALASSNPQEVPVGSDQSRRGLRFADGQTLIVIESEGQAHALKFLRHQGRVIGQIFADYDISHLLRERQSVLGTLVATNTVLAIMLSALGYWAIRRMLAPLSVLSRQIAQSTVGPVHPVVQISAIAPDSEVGRLMQRYNAMAEAFNERESLSKQLAAEERLASLGRLATGIAHEINNPLGGLFNAIDTMKRHGDQPSVRNQSLELVERGLRGIRDVVRTVLATYRADREQRPLTASDLDDMQFLISPEATRRGVRVQWHNAVADEVALPASQVRQILLNVALNAIAVSPPSRIVDIRISIEGDRLKLQVADEGPGLPLHAKAVLDGLRDGVLSFNDGSGLGLWMTRRMVTELGGSIAYHPRSGGGTFITVALPLSHPVEVRHVA